MARTIQLRSPASLVDSSPAEDHRRALCHLVGELNHQVGASRFGDCLVLGLRDAALVSGLADAFRDNGLQHLRIFSVGVPTEARRSSTVAVDGVDLDERGMRTLRGRHHVHRVSVLCVANDFVHSLAAILQRLDSILADRLLLIACGHGHIVRAPVVLSDLQSQTRFSSVLATGGVGSPWVAARLQRNFCV